MFNGAAREGEGGLVLFLLRKSGPGGWGLSRHARPKCWASNQAVRCMRSPKRIRRRSKRFEPRH